MARGHAPRPSPVKEPLPRWARPLAWVTALLAAGCLVLGLACRLQSRSSDQRFQHYEAALEGADHIVAEYLELRNQLQASEADAALFADRWNEANSQNWLSSTFLILETQFQAGNYELCADILCSVQYYDDLLSTGFTSSYADAQYDYSARFQEIADVLVEQGYLVHFLDSYAVPLGTAEVP